MSVTDLVNGVLSGKRRELARLISLIENEDGDAIEALIQLYKHTGKAHIIGVTGPPGSGKSSLVTKLT
ncbi:MAG: methylmalonyl Co-A mutase-associated GTPase MeaB, partial [Candidatus Thorarchaeota archaeon]